MPDSAQHVKPYIDQSMRSKSLHFAVHETQSRMNLKNPYALDLEYTRTMMGFLMFKPEPARLAMIGLGGGSLAKFCWRHLPNTDLQVVEINPHVIALRDEFMVPPDDRRFSVTCGDGAAFVREEPTPVDVLLVDGYDHRGLPGALSSRRFYDDCHDALTPEGIMVVNLHYSHRHYQVYLDRIHRSFGGETLVVVDDEMSNSIVFACKGQDLQLHRAGLVRRPRGLDSIAAGQLLAGFSQIATALRERAGLQDRDTVAPAAR